MKGKTAQQCRAEMLAGKYSTPEDERLQKAMERIREEYRTPELEKMKQHVILEKEILDAGKGPKKEQRDLLMLAIAGVGTAATLGILLLNLKRK